jgi:hypothetical protein
VTVSAVARLRRGGVSPRCPHACRVATRPRGYGPGKPWRTKEGSATSLDGLALLPHGDGERRDADRSAAEPAAERVEHGAVEPVETEGVHLVEIEARWATARGTTPSARTWRSRGPGAAAGWRSGRARGTARRSQRCRRDRLHAEQSRGASMIVSSSSAS